MSTIVTITAFQNADAPDEGQDIRHLGWAPDIPSAVAMLSEVDITHGRPGHYQDVLLEEVAQGLFAHTGARRWLSWQHGRWQRRDTPERYENVENVALG